MKSGQNIKIEVPQGAAYIISRLEKAGFEGYAVGGCVRDSLLGRVPKDWDITTSATPEDIHRLFAHTVDTGSEHGTVTVLVDHEPFEVTTFRIDGKYKDGRHPEKVTFTPSLTEDLKRRDFTVNAMAYSDRCGLVDLFDGTGDLEKGIIRCVGVPAERFGEDALRMMRAVRFAAQLHFSLDEDTALAVKTLAPTLERISAERICAELLGLLLSDEPDRIETMRHLGLTKIFLPEYDRLFEQSTKGPHHDSETVGEHTVRVLKAVPSVKVLRLAALLHDIAKPDCAETDRETGNIRFPSHAVAGEKMAGIIMRRLKLDRETMDRAGSLIRYHSALPQPDMVNVRKFAAEAGPGLMEDWLLIKEADIRGQSREAQEERLPVLEKISRCWQEIRKRGDCLRIRELAVSGSDLIADGMKPGRQIGQVLAALLDEVLQDPACNRTDILLARSRKLRAGGCVPPGSRI